MDGRGTDTQNAGDERGRLPVVDKFHRAATPAFEFSSSTFGSHTVLYACAAAKRGFFHAGLSSVCVMASVAWLFPTSRPMGADAQDRPTQIDPKDQKAQQARELLAKAQEHVNLTSWDRAIEHYQEVLKLFPDYVSAHFGMGVCYEGKKDTNKAVEQFRIVTNAKNAPPSVVEEATSRIEELLIPALSVEHQEKYEIAAALLEKAMRLKKESMEGNSKADDYQQPLNNAITRFEQLQKDAGAFIPLYLELGLAYELAGQNQKAVEAYEQYFYCVVYGSM